MKTNKKRVTRVRKKKTAVTRKVVVSRFVDNHKLCYITPSYGHSIPVVGEHSGIYEPGSAIIERECVCGVVQPIRDTESQMVTNGVTPPSKKRH